MKYTIEGFQQKVLLDYGLDDKDALILRYVVDYKDTGELATVTNNGKTYFWIKYQGVIDNLPILRINSREVIARRFDKFVDCGLMEKYISNNGGVYTCFRFVEKKYKPLVDYKAESIDSKVDPSTQKSKPIDSEVETPLYSKVETKDSSKKINYSKNNDDDGKSQSQPKETLFDESSKESSSCFEELIKYGITESQITSIKTMMHLKNLNNDYIFDKLNQFKWLEKNNPVKYQKYKNKAASLLKSITDDWIDQDYIKAKNKPPKQTHEELINEKHYLKAVRIIEFYNSHTGNNLELTDDIQKTISNCCLCSDEIEFIIAECIEKKLPFNLKDLLKQPDLKTVYKKLKVEEMNSFKNKFIEQTKIKVG